MIFLFIRPRSGYEVALVLTLVAASVLTIITSSPIGALGAALCFIALLGPRLSPARFIKSLVSLGILAFVVIEVFGLRVGFVVTLALGTLILSAAEFTKPGQVDPTDQLPPE